MLILRLRQSEVALADGRLDEAYQLANDHDLARHRRGQRLLTRLTEAFVDRGNGHLKAQRYASALADCEKAAKLSGNLTEIVALRAAAQDGLQSQHRQEQRHGLLLAAARSQVDQGRLDAGAHFLANAPDDISRARLLRHDIQARKNTASLALRAAKLSMDHDDLHVAVDELTRARSADAGDPAVRELCSKLSLELRRQSKTALETGNLDLAGGLIGQLQRLDPANPDARQLQSTLTQLQETWQCIRQGDFAEARILVARLSPQLPNAKWLKEISEHLGAADRTMSLLKAAPLAALDVPGNEPIRQHARPAPMPQIDPLPSQFILHADGIGSFLVVRSPVVTIGPISSSVAPDIALIAEPSLSPIRLQRFDDDYFFNTGANPGKGKLLASGQKLELSPRCRMTFRLPSPASTSAILDLTGARLPRPDIRQVILMDQDLIIGPASASHVQAASVTAPVVLHVHANQLYCQSRQPISINDQPANSNQPIAMGVTLKTAGLSFVVTSISGNRR